MILIGRDHIAAFLQKQPSAGTALAMWQAIVRKVAWRSAQDAIACFPKAKFITPTMAHFHLTSTNCVVTTQIAFNTGILIVLAVAEIESPQIHG